MSEADQFWPYADEAMRWARRSKTAREKRTLLELAPTWSQAALASATIGPHTQRGQAETNIK